MTDIAQLKSQLESIKTKLGYVGLTAELELLKEKSRNPLIWDDPNQATQLMQQLSQLEKTENSIAKVEAELLEIKDIVAVFKDTTDESSQQEIKN